MKFLRSIFPFALVAFFFAAGCSSIEVGSGGGTARVLTGVVNAGTGLPAGAEVLVRLVTPQMGNESVKSTGGDMPVVARPGNQGVDRVLGEFVQKLAAGTADPVPFTINYEAEDAVLRRGLNLEVRVSYGGKLRYRTLNAHVVTIASSAYRQEVLVQAVER